MWSCQGRSTLIVYKPVGHSYQYAQQQTSPYQSWNHSTHKSGSKLKQVKNCNSNFPITCAMKRLLLATFSGVTYSSFIDDAVTMHWWILFTVSWAIAKRKQQFQPLVQTPFWSKTKNIWSIEVWSRHWGYYITIVIDCDYLPPAWLRLRMNKITM